MTSLVPRSSPSFLSLVYVAAKRTQALDKHHDLRMAMCTFESVVHGKHIYKEVWTPRIGEELLVEKEPGISPLDSVGISGLLFHSQ